MWTCLQAVVWRRSLPAHTQAVELRSLWQEQACVVAGLRRFGCMVCRWIARDLSNLKGLLDQHGVRLVGVGPEALGLQEFLDGGYFAGGACAPHPPPPAPAPQLPNRPETPLLRLRAFACLLLTLLSAGAALTCSCILSPALRSYVLPFPSPASSSCGPYLPAQP